MSSFLSLKQAQARTTLSRSTLYRKIAEGTFPRQFSITPRRVVWSEEAVEEWMKKQQAQSLLRVVNLTVNHGAV